MIKISENVKRNIIETGVRLISYGIVVGIGYKLNTAHTENEMDKNAKITDLECQLIELKKSRIRSEINELQK